MPDHRDLTLSITDYQNADLTVLEMLYTLSGVDT